MKRHPAKFAELFRVKHGYAFKGEFFDTSGEYVLLTPGNFNEWGGYRDQGEKQKRYSGDVPNGFILEEGDILVAMTEQTPGLLGSSLRIPASGRYLHNQRLGKIVDVDESRLDRKYLYHLFNTTLVRHQISASASGTKVRHTAPERIGRVEIELPSVPSQQRIAGILSTYDDLIENNRRRMVLLEESARHLYQEWFVRLRFPGHEHTCIVDGVPEGWERRTFGDLCTDLREIVSPDELDPATPYIGLEHIPRRSITLAEWGRADSVTSSKLRYCVGDVLFGKIRPYFHKVGIAFTDGVTSSDAIVLRANSDKQRALVLMTASSDPFIAEVSQTMREGSKMPRADVNVMRNYPVPVPPSGLLDSFSETINAITHQLRVLCFQNQRLRAARDLLLPRLMSGEVAV